MKLRLISVVLLAVMFSLTFLSSCSNTTIAEENDIAKESAETVSEAAVTAEPNILDGLDFDGESFRIQMSATTISSNDYMEGLDELTGDVAFDAAYERNATVQDRLNVSIEYTDTDWGWGDVTKNIRTLVMAGDDEYDLIVNDQIGLATASIEKLFLNVNSLQYFDFEKPYWWTEYMKDLTIGDEKMYLLVGDYFIDVLRKSHVIYYNRDIFNDLYGDPDSVYTTVFDGKWTYDELLKYISDAYMDTDGDNAVSVDDRFGMIIAGVGGSIFPFSYSADADFITRDAKGIPTITMNNERADKLYSYIYKVFYNNGTYHKGYEEHSDKLYNKFLSSGTLFLSTVSIGDFDRFRDMPYDIGLLPYPKLDETQEDYITVIHDTAEIGAIPLTCQRGDFASAVIQALCEESYNTAMPAYYETALKIKYSRDDNSAHMIDIIHDSINGLFTLIYGANHANNIFTWAFLEPLQGAKEAWMSSYEKRESAAVTQLQELVDAYLSE